MVLTPRALLLELLVTGAAGLAVPAARIPRTPQTAVRRAGRIVCAWGPEPVWTSLSVKSIADAADGITALTIEPPSETAKGFVKGGQYVQVREPGAAKAAFFAIASPPGAKGPFEFLVKEQPASEWSPGTAWLTGAVPGRALEMSQVMGGGFKEVGDATSVLLFAAGTGISPIRSVIESGALKGKSVTLYYGAQTPAKMAYQDKFDAWEKMGVKCVPVISKPDGSWKGATGYVQDVARAGGVPPNSAFLLCGMKGMAEGVKALAKDSGVPEDKVIANF